MFHCIVTTTRTRTGAMQCGFAMVDNDHNCSFPVASVGCQINIFKHMLFFYRFRDHGLLTIFRKKDTLPVFFHVYIDWLITIDCSTFIA